MRLPKTLIAVLAGALAMVAGCGPGGFNGVYNMPLPGGADLGSHPYTVTARFDNALNLVPQAAVKVNSVGVGKVTDIRLSKDTRSAIVEMTINGDVDLPANAAAQLRQESLLGAKFVAVSAPEDAKATGTLADGARIPLDRTARTAEIEEVFGALSMLLTGGGVEQIRTIAKELNNTLSGNEPEIRALLSRADRLATELDAQKGDILRAIDGVHKLSDTLVDQTDNLTDALENLGPGLKILNRQQDQLVRMLSSLKQLSDEAVEVVHKSGEQTVANLTALRPILQRVADAGGNLPQALRLLPTYPYPSVAGKTLKGDYANVEVVVDLRLDVLAKNFKGRVDQTLDILPDSLSLGQSNTEDTQDMPLPETDSSGDAGTSDGSSSDSGDRSGDPAGGLLGSLLGGSS